MKKLETQIKSAKTSIKPSDGFVDDVMNKLDQPQKQPFSWPLVATALGALALALVGVTNFVNQSDSTAVAVENDISEIENILAELESGFADSELDGVEQ